MPALVERCGDAQQPVLDERAVGLVEHVVDEVVRPGEADEAHVGDAMVPSAADRGTRPGEQDRPRGFGVREVAGERVGERRVRGARPVARLGPVAGVPVVVVDRRAEARLDVRAARRRGERRAVGGLEVRRRRAAREHGAQLRDLAAVEQQTRVGRLRARRRRAGEDEGWHEQRRHAQPLRSHEPGKLHEAPPHEAPPSVGGTARASRSRGLGARGTRGAAAVSEVGRSVRPRSKEAPWRE